MMSQPSPISLSKRFLAEDSRGRADSDPTAYVFAKRRQERVSDCHIKFPWLKKYGRSLLELAPAVLFTILQGSLNARKESSQHMLSVPVIIQVNLCFQNVT